MERGAWCVASPLIIPFPPHFRESWRALKYDVTNRERRRGRGPDLTDACGSISPTK